MRHWGLTARRGRANPATVPRMRCSYDATRLSDNVTTDRMLVFSTDCVLPLPLRLRANPFLVGGHPIISNFPLCSREEYFAAADLITIESFQPVLYVCVPLQARIRLRPKVLLLVGAADLNRNEMVDLAALGHVAVAMMLAAGNAIGVVNGLLFVFRHVANAPAVIGCADHRKADRFADSNCVAHQLRETCCGLLVWYGQERFARCFGLVGKLVVVGSDRNCCEQQC